MKVGALKREADARAAEARAKRLEYDVHAKRSLEMVRRQVGSTAGLAIAFSLGFMAGTPRRRGGDSGRRSVRDRDKGIGQRLAHGPVAENVVKLVVALLTRSLTKLMSESRQGPGHAGSTAAVNGSGVSEHSSSLNEVA